MAVQTFGVPHPSGYPLYILLAKPFTWLPIGSIAWRVNLFSAVSDAAAVFLLVLTVGELTGYVWAGVVAGALFAFSPTVWTYAVAAEVFALNNLLVALQLFLAARWWLTRDLRFVYATALAVGLGVSNHLTSGVTGAVILAGLLWHTRESWRRLVPVLELGAALLAGLLPYLMMPVASALPVPSPAQWGDQSTLSGLVTHVLRREYGVLQLGGSQFQGRVETLDQLAYYGRDVVRQLFWVGVPLAGWGVYRGMANRRLRGAVAISILAYAVFLVSFHSLANLPLDQPLFHGIVARFWQQPNLIACAWAGLGLAAHAPRFRRFAAPVFCVVILAGQVGLNWRTSDHHDGWTLHDYGLSLLRPLPRETLVLTHGDILLNTGRYLQSVEGSRPDLRILDQEMLTFRWMKGQVLRRMPDLTIPGTHYHVSEPGGYTLRQLVDANIDRRPIVVCGGVKEGDTSLEAVYDRWPIGLCDQLLPKTARMDVADWYERSQAALPMFRSGTLTQTPVDSWERVAWSDYFEARHRRELKVLTLAIARVDVGLFDQAAAGFDELLRAHPSPPPYYFKNAGIAYNGLSATRPEMARKAIDAWRTYLRFAPSGDPDVPAIGQAIANLEAVNR